MVDNFSDLAYVHLTRIQSQEDNLAGKSYFERWASTFGVKINKIMQGMEELPNNLSYQ